MISKLLLATLALGLLLLQAQPAGIAGRVETFFAEPSDRSLALEKLAAKDYPSLLVLLREKSTATPSGERLAIQGSVAFLAGDMRQAITSFTAASALSPLADNDTFTWAMAYVKLDDPAHASALLSGLSKLHPDQSLYIYWLGRIDYNLRRYAEAVSKLKKAVSLDPQSPRSWNALGLAYDMQGQLEPAGDAFETAAKWNRQSPHPSPWPPHDLGAWYLRVNRWSDAECAFRESLRYDPALAQAHYHLARALEKQQHDTQAITEYQTAIAQDKSSAEACYSLALLYRKLHREPEAQAMLTEYKARKKATH